MSLFRSAQFFFSYAPLLLFMGSSALFMAGSEAGFWPFILIFLSVPVGFVLAVFCVASSKCRVCGERFFHITFIFWPFQSHCKNCQSHRGEALTD